MNKDQRKHMLTSVLQSQNNSSQPGYGHGGVQKVQQVPWQQQGLQQGYSQPQNI